jgi:hemoglobin-like flavoprotein
MEIFNARLFEAAPAVHPLFAGTDLKRQPAMLLSALVLLRDPRRGRCRPCTRSARGMSPTAPRQPHNPVVGEVLIGAMAAVARDAWRDEYTTAWGEAFGVVAGAMLAGAAEAELPRAA